MDNFVMAIGSAKDGEAALDGSLQILDMSPGGTSPDDDLYIIQLITPNGDELYFNRTAATQFQRTLGDILDRYDPIEDNEIDSMQKAYRALRGLDPDAYERVFTWIKQRMAADEEKQSQAATT